MSARSSQDQVETWSRSDQDHVEIGTEVESSSKPLTRSGTQRVHPSCDLRTILLHFFLNVSGSSRNSFCKAQSDEQPKLTYLPDDLADCLPIRGTD
eukprot:5533942-Pleurochrysis_carterae.AAC.2